MPHSTDSITLQDYLKLELSEGKTEFRVVAGPQANGPGVRIYIHPLGKDGESRNFIVDGEMTHDVTEIIHHTRA